MGIRAGVRRSSEKTVPSFFLILRGGLPGKNKPIRPRRKDRPRRVDHKFLFLAAAELRKIRENRTVCFHSLPVRSVLFLQTAR